MEYQIPQWIEEEVKFVGPLTLSQLWIMGVGAGLTILCGYLLTSLLLKIFLGAIFLGTSSLLAFVKLNGLPLYKLAMAAIRHFWLPKYYFWTKETLGQKQSLKEGGLEKRKKTIFPQATKTATSLNEEIAAKSFGPQDIKKIASALDIKKKKW